ncbi:hypothetical protein MLD38_003857 [Melastoma candidum]|uniref:Uncharacterized protein n=1 Tax=Melastoma candidum TaxID=119954 RepID=A0ACB9S5F0_9MYRT|nr:hypothetical protein MLD38_003857 [Melastoma candidum]
MSVDARKLEVDIELWSPADDFYNLLVNDTHHFITASPDTVQALDIHEGDGYTTGSIKSWTYCVEPGGAKEIFKERVVVDEQNKTMEMVAVSGNILEQYKTYKLVYTVFEKDGTGFVKLQLVYEKFRDTDLEPDQYLNFLTNLLKATDSYLFQKQRGTSH